MYLNFSNFRGRTSAGGGTSLGPKMGTSVGWGDWQNFRRMGGTPRGTPSPPRKKPWCPPLIEIIQTIEQCFSWPTLGMQGNLVQPIKKYFTEETRKQEEKKNCIFFFFFNSK